MVLQPPHAAPGGMEIFRPAVGGVSLEAYYASRGVRPFRVSHRQPLPGSGFRSPLGGGPGTPVPGQIDPPFLGRLAVESNSVLSLISFLGRRIERVGYSHDPDFNPSSFSEKISSAVRLSDDEVDYLGTSKNEDEYLARLSDVYAERRYYEGLAGAGGEALLVGLAAGILDPINFVPFLGWGKKVATGVRIGRAARRAWQARGLRLAAGHIGRSSAIAAGENVIIESGLQALVQSDRVTPSMGEAAFNIGGAGVFGALLGGGIRGVGIARGAFPGGGEAASRALAGAKGRFSGLVDEALPELRRGDGGPDSPAAPDTAAPQADPAPPPSEALGMVGGAVDGRPKLTRSLVGHRLVAAFFDADPGGGRFVVAVPDFSKPGSLRRLTVIRAKDFGPNTRPIRDLPASDGGQRLVVSLEAAKRSFDARDSAFRTSTKGLPDNTFETAEDWLDYLVVRAAVASEARTKPGLEGVLREAAQADGPLTSESLAAVALARFNESRALLSGADTPSGESLPYSTAGATPAPAPNSVPLARGARPVAAMETHLILRGYPREIAKKAIRAWARVSPVVRIATSDNAFARDLFSILQLSPVYQRGQGQSTPAKVAVERRMAEVTVLEAETLRSLRKLNRSRTRKDPWRHDELSSRIFVALNRKDADEFTDELTPIVTSYATRAREIMEELADDLEALGIAAREKLNEGESFLSRVYNLQKVSTPAFIEMLARHLPEEVNPYAIQKNLLSRVDQTPDLFRSSRGATRARALSNIPFDELRPFLQNDGMSVFRMSTRRFAGEIEFRRSMLPFLKSRFPDIRVEDLFTERGDLDLSIIEELLAKSESTAGALRAAAAEFRSYRGRAATDIAELREAYPELVDSPEFRGAHISANTLDGLLGDGKAREGEAHVLAKILNMAIDDVRGREGVPDDPDSWLKTRLPNLLRDVSHMAFGGGVGLSSLADLPIIVGRMGFSRSLGASFKPLISGVENLNLSKEQAHRAGLGFEHIRSTWARMIRNESVHLETQSWIESAAAKGASWMNTLSGLSYVANIHQVASARVTMDFVGEMIERMGKTGAEGISPSDGRRLAMMGLGRRRLEALARHAAEADAIKTVGGVRVFDGEAMSREGRDLLTDTLISSEYQSRSLPGRMEMPVNSSDPWKSLLWMYRSWIVGNTNRILLSGLSTPDKAWAMGIVSGIGVGGMIYSLKVAAGLVQPPQSPQAWASGAVDQSGVLGVLSEGNNLVNRASGGTVGFGGQRYFAANTTIGAVLGPSWGLTRPLTSVGADFAQMRSPDAMDVHRVRQVLPGNQIFYLKWLVDMMDPGVQRNDSEQPDESGPVRR